MKSTRFYLRFILPFSLLVLPACSGESDPQTTMAEEAVVSTLDPCSAVVIQYLDTDGNILKNELRCEGSCQSGECSIQFTEDNAGNRRSWCACEIREPEGCHLILYQPKEGSEMIFCSGQPGCAIHRDTLSVSPDGGILEIRCATR